MTSNATATTTTGDTVPASPEAILRAMREIDLLPKNKDWLLVDPAGNCWKTDDIALLMGILARHHPLMRPVFPNFIEGI